jgi:hypothetical protein
MKYAKELNEVIDNGFRLLERVLREAAEIDGEWDYRTKFETSEKGHLSCLF